MKHVIFKPTKEQCKKALIELKKQLMQPLTWSKNEGITKKKTVINK